MDTIRHQRASSRAALLGVLTVVLLAGGLVGAPASWAKAAEPEPSSSVSATWDCTGSPCPWGAQNVGQVAVWPASVDPIRNRHGYTTSVDVYAPGSTTSGYEVTVHSGTASVYAGTPTGSHRLVEAIATGGTVTLPAIGADEVFSVQSGSPFTYTLTPGTLPDPGTDPDPDPSGPSSSAYATWDCTSSPCPWGAQTTGHAVPWPASVDPIRNRHGYTTSIDVYAPGSTTSGYEVTVHSGTASVYAGTPTGSHRLVEAIATGGTVTLPAIGVDEVFSVQSGSPFTYTLRPGTLPDPGTDPDPDPSGPSSSVYATWDCTSSPCPWGAQTTGHAVPWPASVDPIRNRHGYTTSIDVYAPGSTTSGYEVTVHSGTASVYAGTPTGSHRLVEAISAGGTVTLPAIGVDEVFSVQSGSPFTYTLTPGTPLPPTEPACQDPTACDPVAWTAARWICNLPGCTDGDWVGGVISWPSWSAYDSNGRSHGNSRTVYADDGTKLHPYMGAWADGCEVTAVTGEILIIEWERGTDVWRETVIGPGETHTIDLVGTENGAMLETPNNSEPFTASLANCTPEPIDAG